MEAVTRQMGDALGTEVTRVTTTRSYVAVHQLPAIASTIRTF